MKKKPVHKRHFNFALNSLTLFRNQKVVQIKHMNDIYNLRLTKNNKIILTK
ncbi:MAG: hemin uptake protein HemP [Marinicella sp.]